MAATVAATESDGGVALGAGTSVQLEGLVDRVPSGGGGDVDQLLDVPSRGLGEVRGHVEAAGHPGDVTHVELVLGCREVGIPVGAGRIP
jgi:hypothetical protein